MNIGIIGSGKVAHALATGWREVGHNVLIGARSPESERNSTWLASGGRLGTPEDAARFGEAVLLAINPWTEIKAVLQSLGSALDGKLLIDLSNNIEFVPAAKLAFTDRTMAQAIQAWAPTARVVKTLNAVTFEMMCHPHDRGVVPAVMWMSGDDAAAKSLTRDLLLGLGWDEVIDLGGLELTRLQEGLSLILTNAVADVVKRMTAERTKTPA